MPSPTITSAAMDFRGLAGLLSRHLYHDPDVYLRDLLQSAVDAIAARRRLEPGLSGVVSIEVVEPGELVITDNGIGLTGAELVELLANVGGDSGQYEMVRRRPVRFERDESSRHRDHVGQFGVGLLACFLVADEVTVLTRSAKDPEALRWHGLGDGTYEISPAESSLPIGTRVHLRARAGVSFGHVSRSARRYGGLLPVPVRMGSTQVNDEPPPWELPALTMDRQRENALGYARRVLDLDPLDAIPLHADGVRGVAFVLPHESSPHRDRVCLRRMLLSESAERLLPDWAVFVRCVIDADDLLPNVARDGFVEDERLAAVREQLGRCIRDHLVDLARMWPSRLAGIAALHRPALAALAANDGECRRLFDEME
ncbi:ATP-binding protein [Kutzneria sp. CA-103260]|uniref:ATP-binding protein n=1 Tax=Kutzneria sp. CA-103260 TaxID=2802641 RepID=UPI002011DE03|nr:ATP-binding protein [Kutzneria sp. CA-103260]